MLKIHYHYPLFIIGVIEDSSNKGTQTTTSSNSAGGSATVANNGVGSGANGVDIWSSCLCSFLEKDRVTSRCLSATTSAWTIVFTRLSALCIVVEPT